MILIISRQARRRLTKTAADIVGSKQSQEVDNIFLPPLTLVSLVNIPLREIKVCIACQAFVSDRLDRAQYRCLNVAPSYGPITVSDLKL